MKKLLIFIFLLVATLPCLGQIYTCTNINGYWGKWEQQYVCSITGNFDNFVLHSSIQHPSEYYCKVVIQNFSVPDKKTKRIHNKNKIWYEYTGYIEYYVASWWDEGDFVSVFPSGAPYSTKNGYRLKRSKATIKIAPYKKSPRVYNIWFEGYGVGIQLY